jgi:glycosyltransferase involved in cell wall biosynthesis
MKICFLSSLHPPRDKRVFDKEAVSLAAAGFDVTHLAPGPKATIVENGVRIVTRPAFRGILGRICNGPRLWLHAFRLRADCYHCNEVDSWIVGVLLKLVLGSRVVFDVHEAYPEEFAESRFPKALRPLITASIRLLFRVLLRVTDRVVLAKESVARDFPDASKRVLVRNYVSREFAARAAGGRARRGQSTGIRVIHIGLISRRRGWPQLLAAMACAEEAVEMTFVGECNDWSDWEFRAQVRKLGLEDRVVVEPWLPFEQAYQRVAESDVGIVAFQPGSYNHVHALPHKMFDYMVAGIPLVVPEFAVEVVRIVRDADCGLAVDTADPTSISRAFDRLARDPQERARLGENGRKAVLTRYNWQHEAAELEKMYRQLSQIASHTVCGNAVCDS